MTVSLDQILPSLQSLGTLAYWLIGASSMLEAFFVTGVVVPGTLIVDAGGILSQRGLLDFFDLVWFVAIGSALGCELSYWTGRLAMTRMRGRGRIEQSKVFHRAQALFRKRGGGALVLGRFLGPVSGLVPLAAAMAGMERRRFVLWNIAGAFPYAIAHVALGYVAGDVLGQLGGALTRVALLVAMVLLLLALLWGLLYSALRLLPLALTVLGVAARATADLPPVRRWIGAHPRSADWASARFDPAVFTGLPLTGLTLVIVYVGGVWLDSVVDFVAGDQMLQFDARLAELIHAFQAPVPILIASRITALGSWPAVWALMAAALIWLALQRRRALAIGLLVSVLGSTVSVAILKMIFQRPRSPLGYFLETSDSFPSGHAAASIGFYAMLFYVIWRAGRLRAETALLAAGLAAFAIGGSRIYLIEHYLTDVLNGWLVGLLWVLVAISVSEWRLHQRPYPSDPRPVATGWRRAGIVAMVLLVGAAGASVAVYAPPLTPPVQHSDRVLADPSALGTQADFPAVTQSLLGSPLHPINLILLARDTASVENAVQAAGWTASHPPSLGGILDALYAAMTRDQDPTVQTVSHFWNGAPNDLSFVPSGALAAKSGAISARFWRSNRVTKGGLRVFAGTVGTDPDQPAPSDARLADALVAAGATRRPDVTLQDGQARTTATVLSLP